MNVAWSALFSESTYDHSARVTAIKFSQLAILLSVNIIAVAEKVSHSVEVRFSCLHCFLFQMSEDRSRPLQLWTDDDLVGSRSSSLLVVQHLLRLHLKQVQQRSMRRDALSFLRGLDLDSKRTCTRIVSFGELCCQRK